MRLRGVPIILLSIGIYQFDGFNQDVKILGAVMA
jgi:hypothetical protein